MNSIIIFKVIYTKIYTNIFRHSGFKNINNYNKFFIKFKTAKTLNKINTIYDKYKYYYILDQNIIYFLSQKYYFCLYNFIKRIKYKKYRIYNKYDINYETINDNSLILNVYMNKFIYRFTISDIINIIKHNLYYYQDESDNVNINITIQSNKIKNPYTNEELPISVLYNLYHILYFNNKSIPYILLIFYKCNFDIFKLNFDYRDHIVKNTFKQYANNLDKTIKYNYFKKILIDFLRYLYVNVDYKSIKFKISITIKNDIILNDIINNILNTNNNLIFNYTLSRYYFNNNNTSLSTYYKLINYNIIMTSRELNIIKDIFGINKSILIYIILNSNQNDIFNRELSRLNYINPDNNIINNDIINNDIINNDIINNDIINNNLNNHIINFYNTNYKFLNRLVKVVYNVFKIINKLFIIYYLLNIIIK